MNGIRFGVCLAVLIFVPLVACEEKAPSVLPVPEPMQPPQPVATRAQVPREPMVKDSFKLAPKPTPPAQHKPWSPPEGVDPELVGACKLLFGQGVADPRELPYREVQLGTMMSASGEVTWTAHAWVLPDEQHAVTWDGIVYPVTKVGPEIQVRTDIEALLAADLRHEAGGLEWTPTPDRDPSKGPPERRIEAWSEHASVDHKSMLPFKAVMLCRLGDAELTERFWSQWKAGLRQERYQVYHALVRDWLWAMFNRALKDHLACKDAQVLMYAEHLERIRPIVLGELEKQKVKCPMPMWHKPANDCLYFLEPISALVEDQRRRARLRSEKPGPVDGGSIDVYRSESVSDLILALDEVHGRQWKRPGGISFFSDPIFEALVEKGEEAVEPLIDCLESDRRLTRSAWSSRPWEAKRVIPGVHMVAERAISNILKVYNVPSVPFDEGFSQESMAERKRVAGIYRSLWKEMRGRSRQERWLVLLTSDLVEPDQWREVASELNQAIVKEGGRESLGAVVDQASKLLRKHIVDLGCGDQWDRNTAFRIGRLLGPVDPEGTRRALADQARHLLEPSPDDKKREACSQDWMPMLTVLRIELEDKHAAFEYTVWLKTRVPHWWWGSSSAAKRLRPLVEFPNDRDLAKAGDWLFNHPDSPWFHSFEEANREGPEKVASEHWSSLPLDRLIRIRGYRRFLAKRLADRRHYASFVRKKDGIHLEAGGKSWIDYLAETKMAVGRGGNLRVQDVVAAGIATTCDELGAPPFALYASKDRRNRALAAIRRWLKRFKPGPMPQEWE